MTYDDHLAAIAADTEHLFIDIDKVYYAAAGVLADGMSNGEPLDYIITAWPEKIAEFESRAKALELSSDWFVGYRIWHIERERQYKFQQAIEATGEALPF